MLQLCCEVGSPCLNFLRVSQGWHACDAFITHRGIAHYHLFGNGIPISSLLLIPGWPLGIRIVLNLFVHILLPTMILTWAIYLLHQPPYMLIRFSRYLFFRTVVLVGRRHKLRKYYIMPFLDQNPPFILNGRHSSQGLPWNAAMASTKVSKYYSFLIATDKFLDPFGFRRWRRGFY